ncbi:MAG: CopD family protein [Burkholderiaceae bacterium]|nr:CopD family protein [Burkholderiaceae bacterium]
MAAFIPWLKFIHLSALMLWCGCLFALPALLAQYRGTRGHVDRKRLQAATRFTYIAVASPAAIVAVIAGTLLIHPTQSYGNWMIAKLTLVAVMIFFHAICGKLILVLHDRRDRAPQRLHLMLVLVPALLVPVVLWLVLAQPVFGPQA